MAKKGIEAGRAYVKAWLDDSAVSRGIKRMRQSFASAGRGLMTVGGGLLGGAAGIAALFIKPISAASDLQETMSKFDTVFGDRAGPVKQWGDQLAETIGRGKTEVAGFLANTQDLLVPLGFDPGAAETMSKEVTGLAYDLASFNNMQDADVVRDLHAALTGSGEVMKKYGVVVSEAAVKQQLLNDGINPKNATEAQKANARFALILKGTTAAQGDAAKTAGSWANQQKRLSAKLTEVSETVGMALLPVLTPLLEKLSSAVGWVGMMIAKGAGLVKWVFYVAVGMAAAGLAITGLGLVFTVLGSAIGGVMAVLSAIAGAVAFLISPIGLLLAGLTAAAGAGLYFAKQSGFLGEMLDWLKAKFGPLADQVKAAFDVIKHALAAGEMGAAAAALWAGLLAAFLSGKIKLLKIWDGMTEGLRKGLTETLAGLVGKFTEWGLHAQAAAKNAYAALVRARASFARLIGRDELADTFDQEAGQEDQAAKNLRRMAGKAGENATQTVLDNGAKAEKEREKRREQQQKEADTALDEFTKALEMAKTATSQAEAKAAADAAKTPSEPPAGDTASNAAKAAQPAINTAAIVGSQSGADAFLKATQGFGRKITPGEKAIADALKTTNQHLEEIAEGGVVMMEDDA